jgi:ABC-type glutathione transport system ATPase component
VTELTVSGALEVSALTLARGAATVVGDVSFNIGPGTTTALIGESGAGKTSVALAIMGLWPDSDSLSGSIRWGGAELTALTQADYRDLRGRSLALLMQDPTSSLNPSLTIGTQLREVLRLRRGMARRAAAEESLIWLRRVGLAPAKDLARAYVHQLSGGMAQRAALAIALACRPELLIADEPFSSLDPITAEDQIKLLRRMQQEVKFSLLLITHNLRLARELADKVAVLKDGRLIESGAAADLLSAPRERYTKALIAAGLAQSRSGGAQ